MLILRGLLTGALAVITVMYTFRTAVPYPRWMMLPYEHPWLLPLFALALAFIFMMDRAAGAMLILIVAAVALDVSLFGRQIYRPENKDVQGTDQLNDELSEPGIPLALDESEHYALHSQC